jgi:heptose-I-phosphate ethanolaminephosphotransferase
MKNLQRIIKIIVEELPLFIFSCLLLSIPAGLNEFDADGRWHISKVLFFITLIESFSFGVIFCLLDKLFKSYIKWPCIIILMILAEIEIWIFFHFGTRMSPMIMSFVLQTNTSEASEFMKTFIHPSSYIPIILSAFALWCVFYCADKQWNKRKVQIINILASSHIKLKKGMTCLFYTVMFLSIFLILDISIFGAKMPFFKLKIPLSYTTIQSYMRSMNAVGNHAQELSDIRKANREVHIDSCSHLSPIIIVVIGESFNKYHSNLYGYGLNTCPKLQDEQQKGNLYVFSNALSPRPSTDYALKYLYSTKSLCNDTSQWSHNPLFPAIFKKAGYDVRLFDNQCTRTKGDINLDYQCSYFFNPDDISKSCFDYRNTDITHYDGTFVAQNLNHLSNKSWQLVIFHLMGQHLGAEERYPHTSQFNHFNTSNIMRKDLQKDQCQKIADYDNATLYNDFVLNQIINNYRDKNTILVYFSDHGEQIYDNKFGYGRNFSPNNNSEIIKCLNEIPFMIWCSDKYKKSHIDVVNRIQKSLNNPIMNDDVCYLLFDLAGIHYKGNKPNKSFISNSYIKYHRIINDDYDYDAHYPQIKQKKLLTEMTKFRDTAK